MRLYHAAKCSIITVFLDFYKPKRFKTVLNMSSIINPKQEQNEPKKNTLLQKGIKKKVQAYEIPK